VALAFGGALLAVSSTSGLQPFILSQFYALSSPALVLVPQHIDRHVWFFAYAALGAVIWGIYTALLPRAPSEDKNCVPIPASAIYLTLLLVAATIHVFYLASQWKLIAYFQYSIRTKSLLFFLAYSILSLGVAHNLFARVRRDHLISITALAASTYLVFAGGTLLLFVIERPILTPPIAAGFALIITGIHLGRNWQLMSPGSAFLISTIVCYGLSSFFAPPAAIQPQVQATPEFYVDFLHVLTAVFAILSGFTLSRAIERNNKQELCFTSLMEHAARIAKILMAHNASDSLILRLKSAIEHLYGCHMVGGQIREQDLALKSLNDCLDEIAGLIRNHSTDPAQRAAVLNVLQGARRDATSWAANSRFQRVAGFEWLVLMSLMFIMFLISFRVDTGEAIIRLARSAFDAALVIILFAIAEFNAGRPSRSFTLLKFLFLSFPEPYQSPSQTIATQLRYNPVSELLVVTSVAAIAFIGWLKS